MDIVKLLKKLFLTKDIEVIEARLPQPKRPWGRLADDDGPGTDYHYLCYSPLACHLNCPHPEHIHDSERLCVPDQFCKVADGVIAPSMAKYELEGLGPQGATDELVPPSSTNESIL